MKKLLTFVISICMLASMLFGLIGCGHTHSWDSGTVTTEATCSIEGVKTFTCSECEQTKTEKIPTTQHSWDSGKTTTPATCTTDGLKTTTCGICGATQVETITKTGHSYVAGETIEAGCLTHGHITYACECGVSYQEILPAKGKHNTLNCTWQDVTSAGNTACAFVYTPTTQCKDCGASIRGQSHESEIHTYKAEITTQATCSQKGVLTYKCSNCDESYTEDIAIAPNVHTWVELTDSDFTHECSGCGTKKKEIDFSNTTKATLTKSEMSEEVAIKTEKATLQPDAALVEALGDNVELSADTVTANDLTNVDETVLEKIGNNPVYEFALTDGTNDVKFNGGKMVISVPYVLEEGEDPNSIYVWYINGQNQPEEIPATYDSVTGTATFTVEHFSYYTVVRLTAAERCAKLGHNYIETEFEATCSQDGYTFKVCKRCDHIERTQGAEALGHAYTQVVTPATCTEQGWTTHTCSRENCNAQYVSDYTDIIAHSFVAEEPVEPTCTSEGYQKQTCSDCGYSYKSNTYAKIAHNFVSGVCSVCQFEDGTYVEPNVYFNLLESLNPLDGMTISMPNFVIVVSMPGEDGEMITRTISMSESFTYKLDENGYIEGKGQIKMSMEVEGEKEEQFMTMAFKDGKIYTFDKSSNSYTVMKQEDMFTSMFGKEMSMGSIGSMVGGLIPEDISQLIETIKDKGSNPINKVLGSVIEYVFEKEETATGYKFTFNEDNLSEVYEIATTKTISEIIDVIFGENTYASIINFANALPETKVKDLQDSMVGITESCGIDFDDLVDMIQSYVDSSMGTNESGESFFNIKEFLDSNKEMTVAELVAPFMEEPMTIEQIETMWAGYVTQYDSMLTTSKLFDILELIVSKVNEKFGLDIEISEQTLTMVGTIIENVETLLSQGLEISFNTDKEGYFVNSQVVFNQFTFATSDLFTPGADGDSQVGGGSAGDDSVVGGGVSDKVSGGSTISPFASTEEEGGNEQGQASLMMMTIVINGSMKVEKEGSLALDVTQMIAQAESRKNAFKVPTDTVLIGNYYKLMPVGDKLVYVKNYTNQKYFGTDGVATTYNGQNCHAAYEMCYDSTYVISMSSMRMQDSCMDWDYYLFSNSQYVYGAVYKIYYLENGDIIAAEFDLEKTLETDDKHTSSFGIYYNPTTGKYTNFEPHNYFVTEENRPEGCDKWWTVVRTCRNCHHQEVERWHTGHKEISRTITLVDESKGCAGGAVIKYTCLACNKVVNQENLTAEDLINEDGTHTTFWLSDYITTDCGHLVIEENKCPCGQFSGSIWINGDCQFDYIDSEFSTCEFDDDGYCQHGYNEHYTEVYRCAVTDCAYTYRVEKMSKENVEGCNRTIKWINKYYCTSGNEEKIYQSTQINTWTEHGDVSTVERQEGDLLVVENSCSICGNTFQITKTKQMDCGCYKTVYYFDANNGYGYERIYEGTCSYYEFSLDSNGERIPNSQRFEENAHNYSKDGEGDILAEGSCSQPTVYQVTCQCCSDESIERYFPNGHYYNYEGVCEICGTVNNNQADGGVILEDMSTEDAIIIGYYNRYGGKLNTFIELYAGDFVDLIEEGLEILNEPNQYAPDVCGVIIIDKAQLAEKLGQLEITGGEISLYYGVSSPDGDFNCDYILTFTFEEIFGDELVGDAGGSNDANVGNGDNSNEGDLENNGSNGEENLGDGENGDDFGENDFIIDGTEENEEGGSSEGNENNDFIINNVA